MPELRIVPLLAVTTAFVGCYRGAEADPSAGDHDGDGTRGSSTSGDTTNNGGVTASESAGDADDTTGGSELPEGLQVVLLATPESAAAHQVWVELLGQAGFIATVDHDLAGVEPTQAQLDELATRYDVALVTHDGSSSAYASPAWNDLSIGLVTLDGGTIGADGWHWLDVGEAAELVQAGSDPLTVVDPHTVLYGLALDDRGTLQLTQTEDMQVQGYLRQTHGTTDLGFVALTRQPDNVSDAIQQLVLWEPGPFFSDAAHSAAARRAFFGLPHPGSELVPSLTEAGRVVLTQTLEWAAKPGYPVRTDPSFDPVGLFLTWQHDPTTTMTIDWHTRPDEERPSEVRYWADGTQAMQTKSGDARPFPHSDRTIHRVELEGLTPDTVYLFDFGDDSPVFRFRTMPQTLERPLHFLAGGDVRHSQSLMAGTSAQAVRHNPAFIALGGDLAYADGLPTNVGRWHEWFSVVRNGLVSGEGRVVPILVSIGNHEVQGGFHSNASGYQQTDEGRAAIAPFFYELFAFPGQPGYQVLDFGAYMSFVVLDTNHTNPMAGAQSQWLEGVLADRRHVPHVFPIYHVPAYPSHRAYSASVSNQVRQNFVPLFENSSVRTVFENHDHLYKRTEPLREGEVADDGLVFLGDGAWGVSTREPNNEWYLAEVVQVRHFIVGTLDGNQQQFRAFDDDGRLFDSVTR